MQKIRVTIRVGGVTANEYLTTVAPRKGETIAMSDTEMYLVEHVQHLVFADKLTSDIAVICSKL